MFARDVDGDELKAIAKAVSGEKPFFFKLNDYIQGWLLGSNCWELTPKDRNYSSEEIELLILEEADKDRRKFERLKSKFGGASSTYKRVRITEDVRIFVWRRDDGRCVECGSNEKLEYDHIIPVNKGGSSTARNIQLLCEPCNRQKSDHI